MNLLLPAIRDILQTVPLLKRKGDCYITPHENWMPTGTGQPCLGIKAAGRKPTELTCGLSEFTGIVSLVGFVRMAADGETPVCGEAGAYALIDAAAERLRDTWQEIAGCEGLDIGEDSPTDLYVSENSLGLVKLVRTVHYSIRRE